MNVSQNNPLVTNSYFSNLLYYKSFNPNAVNFHSAWIKAWKEIQDGTLFGASIPTASPDGTFNTIIKNRTAVQAQVATATAGSGGSLVLTFTDTTYNAFRQKEKVTDTNMYEGYVSSVAPGTVTITPLNNPTTLVAGTHFAVGSIVTGRGILAGWVNSTGATTIYESKDNQIDYLEITRDSQQIPATEKTMRFAASVNGEQIVYGYTESEADMVNRFIRNVMFKKMFGKGGNGLNGLEGQMVKTYGIRNRLIDSGYYFNTTAVPTQAQFKQALFTAADANPGFEQDMIILPGRQFLDLLATWYPTQVGFAGGQRNGNTMSVTSDIREVNLAGLNVKVAMNFSILNDSVFLPEWMKWSCYILNRSQTVLDGKVRSLISPIHFSMNPSAPYRSLYRSIPGMVGATESDDTGLAMQNKFELTANSIHGYSCEALDNSGVSMVDYGHFLIEYIH